MVSPFLWKASYWSTLGLTVGICVSGIMLLSDWRRHLLIAATIVSLFSVVAALIGADLMHNVLLIQTQVWRALWLLYFFSYLAAGVLFFRLSELKNDGFVLIFTVAFSWIINLTLAPYLGLIFGCIALFVSILRLRSKCRPLPFALQVAIIFSEVLLFFFIFLGFVIWRLKDGLEIINSGILFGGAFGHPTLISFTVIIVAGLFALRLWPGVGKKLLVPVAGFLIFIVSVSVWGRGDIWSSVFSKNYPIQSFEPHLTSDAQVYWEGDPRGAWLGLRRPSYISFMQGGGLLFNRETSIKYQDRLRNMPLVFNGDDNYGLEVYNPLLTLNSIKNVCQRNPRLDAIVLPRKIDQEYVAEWNLPFQIFDEKYYNFSPTSGVAAGPVNNFYLYLCTTLR